MTVSQHSVYCDACGRYIMHDETVWLGVIFNCCEIHICDNCRITVVAAGASRKVDALPDGPLKDALKNEF